MTAVPVPPPFDPSTLGTDLAIGYTGPASVWGLATGLLDLGLAHLRRLTTPPGGLWYDSTYVSVDVLGYLNQTIGATDIAGLQAAICRSIEDDERVDVCSATVSFNQSTGAMNIEILETLVTGQTFALIMQAQNATLALLQIDGVSVQAAVSGTPASPGIQLVVGPAGPAGAQGQQGNAGASGTPQWTGALGFNHGEGYDDSGSETVIDQFWVNFDDLPATVTVKLIGDCYALGGATGTYRVRIGGTKGNADGTVAGTPATANTSSPTQKTIAATISNPTGIKYVTVTAQTDTPGQKAVISDDRAVTIR